MSRSAAPVWTNVPLLGKTFQGPWNRSNIMNNNARKRFPDCIPRYTKTCLRAFKLLRIESSFAVDVTRYRRKQLFQYDKRLRTETEPAGHAVIGCLSDGINHLFLCRFGIKELLAA